MAVAPRLAAIGQAPPDGRLPPVVPLPEVGAAAVWDWSASRSAGSVGGAHGQSAAAWVQECSSLPVSHSAGRRPVGIGARAVWMIWPRVRGGRVGMALGRHGWKLLTDPSAGWAAWLFLPGGGGACVPDPPGTK